MFEKIFEKGLWSTRFFVLLPVIFGLIGAIILFVIASVDVFHVVQLTFSAYFGHEHPAHMHEEVVSSIIDAAKESSANILQIHSLDQLKDKLAKVIVMVLVVSFFQRVLHMEFGTALEMLYFAISILVLSLGLYFLHKGGSH